MGVRTWRQLLAVALACAVVVSAAPAHADQGRGRGRGHDRKAEPSRTEQWQGGATRDYDRGYRDGTVQGEQDARSGLPFRTAATARTDYGVGFSEGYRTGYDREHALAPLRPRRDNRALTQRAPRAYQEPAFESGFNKGFEKGRDDGRDGERYDPVRHREYRDGDRGYSDSYGEIDAYKNNYRAGFRQGYEQGYREGTRGRRK